MRKRLSTLALALAFGAHAEQQGLSVERLNTLNRLHSVVVAPQGDRLVYGVRDPETQDNNLFLMTLSNNGKNPVKQLTYDQGGEHNLVWSKDGKSLFFLSGRSGSSQIWQLPLGGGEAFQVSDLPLNISGFKVAPDGKTFALSMEVKPGCDTLACTRTFIDKQAAKKHTAKAYDKLMVRHWDTWKGELRAHVFTASLEGKRLAQVTDLIPDWDSDVPGKPFSGMEKVAFTADSQRLVFSAKYPGKDHAWTTNYDLFDVAVSGGEIKNLTEDNKAWDSHPVFSSDGRFMAYLAMTKPGYESDRHKIMLKDLRTGELKEVAPLWDRSPHSLSFGPDNRTLVVVAQDLGQRSIFEVSAGFGDVRKIYSQGYASDVQLLDKDNLIFTRHGLDGPADIYRIGKDGYGLKRLTELNKDKLKDVRLGEFGQFNFPGWNDEKVYGYWIKPHNYKEGEKYPVAYLVHGGPQGSFGNMFHFRWNAQLWAAHGYGVVMVDFHGSTGYGKQFTDSIARDWGGKPLEDLKKGLAAAGQQQSWLDVNNACALGASYGGYMMNWIAGNWNDGFKCLVNHAGLYDMPSFYQVTEELWFPEHEMGGPSWDKSEDYTKFNPANFVEHWKTPTLVIHGLKDYRVPYAQGLGAFTTLQRKGIPSRLVIYPDENHWILNPNNLINWYDEVFTWMDKWTAKPE